MAKKKKKSGEKNYSHLVELHAKTVAQAKVEEPVVKHSSGSDTVKGPVVTTTILSAEAYLKHDLFKLTGFIALVAALYAGIFYTVNYTTYLQFLFK